MEDEIDDIDKIIEKNESVFEPTLEKLRKKLIIQQIKILDDFIYPKTGIKFKYINPQTKIPVECSKGHKWFTTYNHIKLGYGCQKCHLKNIYQKGLKQARKYNNKKSEELKELRRLHWEGRQEDIKKKNYL